MNCKTLGVKNSLKSLLSLCLVASLISCQTITISPEGKPKVSSPPDYQQTQHFFLWGLIGEAVVPAGEICGDRSVAQLQSQTTFFNGLWSVLIGSAVSFAIGWGFGLYEDIAKGTPAEAEMATALLALSTGVAVASYLPKTAKVWCGERVIAPVVAPEAANSSETKEAG